MEISLPPLLLAHAVRGVERRGSGLHGADAAGDADDVALTKYQSNGFKYKYKVACLKCRSLLCSAKGQGDINH